MQNQRRDPSSQQYELASCPIARSSPTAGASGLGVFRRGEARRSGWLAGRLFGLFGGGFQADAQGEPTGMANPASPLPPSTAPIKQGHSDLENSRFLNLSVPDRTGKGLGMREEVLDVSLRQSPS